MISQILSPLTKKLSFYPVFDRLSNSSIGDVFSEFRSMLTLRNQSVPSIKITVPVIMLSGAALFYLYQRVFNKQPSSNQLEKQETTPETTPPETTPPETTPPETTPKRRKRRKPINVNDLQEFPSLAKTPPEKNKT